MHTTPRALRGLPLFALLSATTVGASIWTGSGVEDLQQLLRLTARAAGLLFGLAFVARSWSSWPLRWPRWLQFEQFWFLAFSWVHTLHLVVIGVAYQQAALTEKESSQSFVQIGGFTYLLIGALCVEIWTTRLGRPLPGASQLRAFGHYFLWLAFFVDWVRRFELGFLYQALTAFSLLTLALRFVGNRTRQRQHSPSRSPH